MSAAVPPQTAFSKAEQPFARHHRPFPFRRPFYTPLPLPQRRDPMLRRFYDWMIAAAERPKAVWTMAAVSFAESSFFPFPPDVMLVPMSVAQPKRAWFFAAVCTVASVLGGVFGYMIGALLYDSVGKWLIDSYGYQDGVEQFRHLYAEW